MAQAELSVVEEEDCRSNVSDFEHLSVVDDFVRSFEPPPLNVKAPEFKPQRPEEITPLCSPSTPHHRPPFNSHSFIDVPVIPPTPASTCVVINFVFLCVCQCNTNSACFFVQCRFSSHSSINCYIQITVGCAVSCNAVIQTIEKKIQIISFETIKREDLELLRLNHYRVEGICHFEVCIKLFYISEIYSLGSAKQI